MVSDTSVSTADQHETLIASLLDPARWPAGGGDRRRIDTHISTVVLAGDLALKIKKPLDLGFLDFRRLAAREAACREELRVNSRTAPQIYQAVVALTGRPDRPDLGGAGPVIDWAVKMRRFDPDAILSLQTDRLDAALVDRLARLVADFHAAAPRCAADAPYGTAQAVTRPTRDNFSRMRSALAAGGGGEEAASSGTDDSGVDRHALDRLEAWSEERSLALQGRFAGRRRAGHVRECHGDLHLGNIALIDDRPVMFDAIEFDPALRWIDTMNDLAFLYMDLCERDRADLADRLLDAYLQQGGDYAGLDLLRYYAVYRALVRAKVAAIRLGQHLDAAGRRKVHREIDAYLALASRLSQPGVGALVITHGVSGSGKSHAAADLIGRLPTPAVRVRSDIERKRLLGIDPRDAATGHQAYTADLTARTYTRLAEAAAAVAGNGYIAIVDATFLQRAQRERLRDLAGDLGVAFAIIDCDAPPATLQRRIAERSQRPDNVSDADLAVLRRQLETREPLTPEEQARCLSVRPGMPPDAGRLTALLGDRPDA